MHLVQNERIKLLAIALNNLGVGAILAGIVAPMVSGTAGGLGHAVGWFLLGADLIGMGQILLGRLRHES
ncbi:MAG: hypothetical protein JOY71_13755 [Acetobacteraceae bacterium]|nr:hypothetical protein [Acetobacteraceae bacterium]